MPSEKCLTITGTSTPLDPTTLPSRISVDEVLEERSQTSVFGSVISKDKRRHNPPPTSISMALNKNHPISHLPGMNSNYGGLGYENDDQTSPWTQVPSRHRSNRHSTSQSNKNTRFAEQKDDKQPPSSHERHNPFDRIDNERTLTARRTPGGGPPDGGPPDDDGPSGGGNGLRPMPRNDSRRTNESPFFTGRPGGRGQGPPGGDPPGGGPEYGIEPEEGNSAEDRSRGEWQINNKISMGMVPQWNSDPTALIDYIMEIALLARLSKRIFKEIGQIAPLHWTGAAKNWWVTLPRTDQAYFSQDWECLVMGMRDHFMNDEWLNDRGIEFDTMRFCRGQSNARETPEEYFNRRIRLNMVLRPEETDGPLVMHRLMNRQPVLWGSILNSATCPSIVQLIKLAKSMELNLIAQYYNGLRIEKSKSVHTAELSPQETSDLSEGEAGPSSQKEVHAVSKGGPKKRTDWPKGRTIAGYSYSRDDSIVSKLAPPGPCFICLSPKHFFRDCPHNARFFGKSAHSAELVIDHDELTELDLEYYNLMTTANTTSTNYASPESKSQQVHYGNDVEPKDRRNRNERRREMFEMKSNKKGKHKAEKAIAENRASRRRRLRLKGTAALATT